MTKDDTSIIPVILAQHEAGLLEEWIKEQRLPTGRSGQIRESQLRDQCAEFLRLFRDGAQASITDITGAAWNPVREMLEDVSRSRGQLGYSPTETATFILSLKRPLFFRLREELGNNAERLFAEIWNANALLDKLGLYTTEVYQKTRQEVIERQQQDMLELSTPVVKLWEGVLALPLIGTLDSSRTQIIMEALLQKLVETGSQIAIIDITGVPTVDTLVAQHLLKTVAAARLMGAECIISGIRPQIAQTIVHLGVDLGNVVTKGTLADAFAIALQRNGMTFSRQTTSRQ